MVKIIIFHSQSVVTSTAINKIMKRAEESCKKMDPRSWGVFVLPKFCKIVWCFWENMFHNLKNFFFAFTLKMPMSPTHSVCFFF